MINTSSTSTELTGLTHFTYSIIFKFSIKFKFQFQFLRTMHSHGFKVFGTNWHIYIYHYSLPKQITVKLGSESEFHFCLFAFLPWFVCVTSIAVEHLQRNDKASQKATKAYDHWHPHRQGRRTLQHRGVWWRPGEAAWGGSMGHGSSGGDLWTTLTIDFSENVGMGLKET